MAKNDQDQVEDGGTTVYLGNRKAISKAEDGAVTEHPGKRCTTVTIPAGYTLLDAFREITHPAGVWGAHSTAHGPAWIAAQGPLAEPLTALLLAQWPGTEVREPDPDQEG